ncbi:MAG: ferric reductase-like transmembrane domain-containing protein [Pseudomonadota bacterium]
MIELKRRWRNPSVRLTIGSVVVVAFICLLLVLPPAMPSNSFAWDLVMALGYLSAALLIVIPLVSTRLWFGLGGDAGGTRKVLSIHRLLTYYALLYLVLHVVGALIVDSTVIEYLKPSAPWGMLAALLATLLLLVLVVQSEYRIALNLSYKNWRWLHRLMSVLIILGTGIHILEANYFARGTAERIGLLALCFGSAVLIFFESRQYAPSRVSGAKRVPLPIPAGRIIFYVLILITLLLFSFVLPESGNRHELQQMQCLLNEC